MKILMIKSAAILMMLGVFAMISFGQKTERVKFDKGATDGTFTRTIPANGSMDFVINAKAKQYMDYTVAYDFKKTDIEAFLTEPNLQDISQTATIDGRNVFRINTSGDHRLTVNNMTRKSVTFTLYLQITNTDPDADDEDMSSNNSDEPTERTGGEPVKFSAGEKFKSISDRQIPANGSYDFVISAKRGQKLAIHVYMDSDTAVNNRIEGFLSEPNLQDVAMSSKSGERKVFVVKKTGDHRLTVVNNTGKKVTFTLNVDIE